MISQQQVTAFRRLLAKVITQAVEDYQDVLKKDGLEAAKASRVGRWLHESQPDGRGSFPHMCELLEVAPERLQGRLNTRDLMHKMRAHQASLEAQYARYRARVNGTGGADE